MNWNWRYNKINSSAPVTFLRETGVSRPGILVVRALYGSDGGGGGGGGDIQYQ